MYDKSKKDYKDTKKKSKLWQDKAQEMRHAGEFLDKRLDCHFDVHDCFAPLQYCPLEITVVKSIVKVPLVGETRGRCNFTI